uniref:SMP-30/Gluconolactonase/LRE-like region domain-containing protein n=1 Tax=Bionectria ochroleuca TaxID=29856 RepID=A0A8H7K894_BIOOC
MVSLRSLLHYATLAAPISGSPVLESGRRLVSTKVIAETPIGSYLESTIIRPNGDILATSAMGGPKVYTVKGPSSRNPSVEEVASVYGVQSLWGITEIPQINGVETYVFVGGNVTSLTPLTPAVGSWQAFRLSISKHGVAKVEQIGDLGRETVLLNGLTPIPGSPGSVLIADSGRGTMGRLNIVEKKWEMDAFAEPEMAVLPNSPLGMGVVAAKFRDGYLYFASAPTYIYRLRVDWKGSKIPGAKAELVVDVSENFSGIDDFIFDRAGNIYFASNAPTNALGYINTRTGENKIVSGGANETILADCASLAFGRSQNDKNVLYVARGRGFTDQGDVGKVVAVSNLDK